MFKHLVKITSGISLISILAIGLIIYNVKINADDRRIIGSTDYQLILENTKFSDFQKTELFKVIKESTNTTLTGVKKIGSSSLPIIFSISKTDSIINSFNTATDGYLSEIDLLQNFDYQEYLSQSLKDSDISKIPEITQGLNHKIQLKEIQKLIGEKKNVDDFQLLGLEFNLSNENKDRIDGLLLSNQIKEVGDSSIKKIQTQINTDIEYSQIIVDNTKLNQLPNRLEDRPISPASDKTDALKIITSDAKFGDVVTIKKSTDGSSFGDIKTSFSKKDKIFDISKAEYQNQKAQERIDEERNKAIEHNKKVKQYYSEEDIKENPNIEKENRGEVSSIFDEIKAGAKGLNNAKFELLIYSWDNTNLTVDLPNANSTNGTKFQLYSRNGSGAQTFQISNDNQIKTYGKCLDIEGGNINSGTKVQIYTCNGSNAQQWIFDGLYLKVKSNTGLCLDASGGLSVGTPMQIYSCNNSGAQRWVMGSNDFTSQRSVAIYATPTGNISGGQNGHVFVSFTSSSAGIINTMSSWSPANDSNNNNFERYNNIADGDAGYVDVPDDWTIANNLPSTWRMRFRSISKKLSDVYRHNSGYRYGYTTSNFSNNNATITYSAFNPQGNDYNCSRLSTRIWNDIMNDAGYGDNVPRMEWYPSSVYDKLI